MKWHKTRHDRRMQYITLLLDNKIAKGEVYFGSFKKPLPYFYPMLKLLEVSLTIVAKKPYKAYVHIDGIDLKKAKELTNALRGSGFSLGLVRNRKDESEPIIRLADMWAGLIRGSLRGKNEYRQLYMRAKKDGYLIEP